MFKLLIKTKHLLFGLIIVFMCTRIGLNFIDTPYHDDSFGYPTPQRQIITVSPHFQCTMIIIIKTNNMPLNLILCSIQFEQYMIKMEILNIMTQVFGFVN